MSFSENIKEVLELMATGFEKEVIHDNPEVFSNLQSLYKKDSGRFLDVIQYAQTDFNTMVESVMEIPDSDEKHVLEHIISGLYKHFHTERIEKLEGSSCCYDKSTFIEAMTIKALRTQQNLTLFADYKNVEQIKEDKDRQAYWSPKTVKDTDEAMKLFWKWYQFRE